ncbi:electron transfer flavoprotein subunit alpha/FixB family protein [Salinisphaera sp.]|uniref:electron transfer flavoprotein subunit alpha/FixB family protein n=1 Tax=Salinisphaera sp. TaxID=1914330 RepID=UPI002D790F08|nr:FAD-binding protein [Salinisphaera sp.]HET7315525.1 FAD-binding protein [Salinisphaera sp.]
MSTILIIADHSRGALSVATRKAVRCAADFCADAVDILVLAEDGADVAAQAARLAGVRRVRHVDHPAHAHPMAATAAPHILAALEDGGYSHVLGTNTSFGKDVMPRVAALLGVAMLTDLMHVHGRYQFDRPTYAGNAVDTVVAPEDRVLVATVRAASFEPAAENGAAAIENFAVAAELPGHTRFVRAEEHDSERPDLGTAARVVTGGRGVGSEQNFGVIYDLADRIGAAVGASRAAVDAGYVPNDMQVGQTGKIIAPELYICFGISGAIQHLAGIKDAGTIVAVNKDADAPIFEIADYGLVGDLFEVIPALKRALS